ncbi:hypothetical protein ACMS1L_004355, partial [Cronobacter turicensis]
ARGVAGEDEYGVPRRFTLFQQRLPPFGARGAADFQRERVVAVLGAVLCGFPRGKINFLYKLKINNFNKKLFVKSITS